MITKAIGKILGLALSVPGLFTETAKGADWVAATFRDGGQAMKSLNPVGGGGGDDGMSQAASSAQKSLRPQPGAFAAD